MQSNVAVGTPDYISPEILRVRGLLLLLSLLFYYFFESSFSVISSLLQDKCLSRHHPLQSYVSVLYPGLANALISSLALVLCLLQLFLQYLDCYSDTFVIHLLSFLRIAGSTLIHFLFIVIRTNLGFDCSSIHDARLASP